MASCSLNTYDRYSNVNQISGFRHNNLITCGSSSTECPMHFCLRNQYQSAEILGILTIHTPLPCGLLTQPNITHFFNVRGSSTITQTLHFLFWNNFFIIFWTDIAFCIAKIWNVRKLNSQIRIELFYNVDEFNLNCPAVVLFARRLK